MYIVEQCTRQPCSAGARFPSPTASSGRRRAGEKPRLAFRVGDPQMEIVRDDSKEEIVIRRAVTVPHGQEQQIPSHLALQPADAARFDEPVEERDSSHDAIGSQ